MENKILELKKELKEEVGKIKGFDKYTKENQEILLKAYDTKNIKRYIQLQRALNAKKTLIVKDLRVIFSPLGLAIGEDSTGLRVTNHTLYTFLTESKILPTEVKINQKKKK